MPSQISGSTAVAIQVYQALYGKAPSNALLNSYVAQASANPQQTSAAAASAFANDLAGGFSTTTNAALALQVLNNVNITAATVTAPGSYATLLSALEAAFLGFGPASRGQIILNLTNLLAKLEGDATYGVAATGFNNQAYADFVYASVPTNTSPAVVAPVPSSIGLTMGVDNAQGTSGNDLFLATIFDNGNSLQSGDKIAGGAGVDRLAADVGASQNFAITAESTSVETVAIRAQAEARLDSTSNNLGNNVDLGANQINGNRVQIDAQRMKDVTQWESNNSRADLLIEDVRINNNQITKDITIAFVESDPGNVDFGVYFDPYSLRSSSATTSVLTLELLDTRSQALGTGPLKDNPYDSFAFLLNGAPIVVRSPAIDTALTYADLRTAIEAAINALKPSTPALANFTVTLGANFTRFDTQSGTPVVGTAITLTDTGGGTLAINPLAGWATSSGFVPPISGLHTSISNVASTLVELVTSKVILDDVGRGSTGGDLVIGSLSVGTSSSSLGVQRFEIEVLDNSKLQTINSTNNTLREVTIKNGITTSDVVNPAYAGVPTVKDKGNLTVNGSANINGGNVTTGNFIASTDAVLPGTAPNGTIWGFTDVRLIDGSAMTGNLAFSAIVTENAMAKYVNLVDTAASPSADNIAIDYKGGAGNDTLFVGFDGLVAASRSRILSGREDFTFSVDGGAGNDNLTVLLENQPGFVGGFENWANNQDFNDNITILGGAGNDTIRKPGAGDTKIDGGSGNDRIYTDNTGAQANNVSAANGAGPGNTTGGGGATPGAVVRGAWVFNTVDQANSVLTNAGALAARNLNNLRSDPNDNYQLYNASVVVTFKLLPSVAIKIADASFKTTDLQINQAIKQAINTDPTLSALLVARDGPANTLTVESLIDGVMSTGDLSIAFTAPTTLTATEVAGAGAAYKIEAPTEALVLAAMTTAMNTYVLNGDYVTQLATDGFILGNAITNPTGSITGSASLNSSDNFITPGADNDVIVLGTTVGIDLGRSSNEVVIFKAGFGSDVIVNFRANGNGIDHLDLGAFLSAAPLLSVGAVSNAGGTITVAAEAIATNGTAALVKALYDAAALPTAATKMVYIAYDAQNVAKIYSVNKGTVAGDAVVVQEGTIDLADTLWTSLTVDNFKVPTAQAEGASSIVPLFLTATAPNQTLTGTTSADFLDDAGFAGTTMTGGAGPDTFTMRNGSTTTITDLTTGDIVQNNGGANTTANNVSAFVASNASFNFGNLTINSAAASSIVNLALMIGNGVTMNGGAGVDQLTGNGGNDNITTAGGNDVVNGGAGNDTINVTVGGTVAVTGGTGYDFINVANVAGLVVNMSDLGVNVGSTSGDQVNVGAGAAFNATGIANFVTGFTGFFTNNSTNALVVLTSAAAGSVINMTNTAGVAGYTIVGGAGIDSLTGSVFADIITGNGGVDAINLGLDALVDSVIMTAVTTSADRDVLTNFVTANDTVTLGLANTTVATVAGPATVTASTTVGVLGGAAYTLAGGTTANADVVVLNNGGQLTGPGVNSGDLSLITTTNDGTELLKALTDNTAADAFTGITAVAGNKSYLLAIQGANSYLYLANDADNSGLITAAEIQLVGTFVTNNALAAANFLLA